MDLLLEGFGGWLLVWGPIALVSILFLVALASGWMPALRFRAPARTEPPLWSGLEVAGALTIHFGLMMLAGSLALSADSEGLDADAGAVLSGWRLFLVPLIAGVGAVGYVVLNTRLQGQPLRVVGLRRSSLANLVPVSLGYPALWTCVIVLAFVWQYLLVEFSAREEVEQQRTVQLFSRLVQEGDWLGLLPLGLTAVVVAPFVEEILFRGYFFGMVRRRQGFFWAAAFSSIVFSAYHMNLYALVPLALVGWILCLIYERTGSLWYSMLWHAAFNATTLVQLFWTHRAGGEVASGF